ncbi:MAG: hypothetical protein KDB90_17280 [Planctomycetes bacterium]|nr:hypothetical protein [Planctomycetota bacterium]
MRYLPLLALLLLLPACTKTASLRATASPRGASASAGGTVRDPYSGSSASVRATDDGVSTSSSGPSYRRYNPPVVRENIGGATVSIDTKDGDVTASDRLGPFFVRGDNDGVRLGGDVDRWKFCDACYDSGVSFYVDSDDGVHVSEPNPKIHNDYIRAGLNPDHFDVVWRGVGFEKALSSFDGIAKVRLDASASEDGFKVSAVPSIQMTLLDVSADYAVHRLAAHAGLKVYIDESEEFVLKK